MSKKVLLVFENNIMIVVRKIFSLLLIACILLCTTGIKAAVHHCLFGSKNSLSLPFISDEEGCCTLKIDEDTCCSKAYDECFTNDFENDFKCCSTDVYVMLLDFDSVSPYSYQNEILSEVFLPQVLWIPFEINFSLSNFYTLPFDRKLFSGDVPVPQKVQFCMISCYRI